MTVVKKATEMVGYQTDKEKAQTQKFNNKKGGKEVVEKPVPFDPNAWTKEQQQALENALKTFPSKMPANERWNKIANAVENKDKKQCVDRYKKLSTLFKNKTMSD